MPISRRKLQADWPLYAAFLFWALTFTVTMWRLTALREPHWLELCYLALAIVWAVVTVGLVVFIRFSNKPNAADWVWKLFNVNVCAFCLTSLAFIGLGIADLCVGT